MAFESWQSKTNVPETVRQRVPGCRTGVGKRRPPYEAGDLLNVLPQSRDYLTIMSELRSTYDESLTYKISYEGRKAFIGYNIPKRNISTSYVTIVLPLNSCGQIL